MNDLISREPLLKRYKNWITQLWSPEDEGDRRGVETCIMELEYAPTVDAVPVVRCKDCKFYHDKGYCTKITGLSRIKPEEDFCSRGERKDG